MKRLLAIFSFSFLLIVFFAQLPVYAQELDSLASPDDGSTSLLSAIDPISNMDTIVPDLFTGTMRYPIPIVVPAGRKGMAPKLALTYRSTQQNGWLGVGWALEVGDIERDTKRGVDYNNGDSYMLRLNGAMIELIDDNGTYREKIQSAFLRIKANKDSSGYPTSWEVTDKSGVRYLFGRTSDTRQYDPADATAAARVFKWCLDQVIDTNGNYINYTYSKDQGQIYLDHIDYTGNGAILPRNTVTFVRDDGNRADATTMYRANFGVKTAYRLARIDVTADGHPVRSYQLAYTTSAVTSQSLLSSVQQFGSDGDSKLPAVTMQYSPEATFHVSSWPLGVFQKRAFQWYTSNWPTYNWHYEYFFPQYNYSFGDFDGDGLTDALLQDVMGCGDCNQMNILPLKVWRSSGNGFASPTADWEVLNYSFGKSTFKVSADFNGDGKADVLFLSNGSGALNVSLNTGANSFASYTNWLTIAPYDYTRVNLADVDGDGKMDVVYIDASGNLPVSLSTGTNFVTQYAAANMSSIDSNTSHVADKTRYRFADFDGNGKTDVLYIDADGKRWVAFSTGAGFGAPLNWGSLGNGSNPSQYAIADFNGDEKADIVYICKSGDASPAGSIQVALSTGSGFMEAPEFATSFGSGDIERYKFGDFDGNGKRDILYIDRSVSAASPTFLLSTGATFVSINGSGAIGSPNIGQFYIGDFDGDGRVDVGFLDMSGGFNDWDVYESLQIIDFNGPADNPKEGSNLLVNVSNGIGGNTSITYTPSTKYSNTQLSFPVQTVSSVTTCDNYNSSSGTCSGTSSTTSYTYSNGYYRISERDFRGFNHVITTGPMGSNDEQKIEEVWFHQGNDIGIDQNDPSGMIGYMKGKPYRSRVSDASGKVYSETTTSYLASTNTNTNGGYFNPVDTTTTYVCDGSVTMDADKTPGTCNAGASGQSVMARFTYDSYGNALTQQIYNSANASAPYMTKSRAYTTDDVTNYLVGLLKSETVFDAAGTVASSATYYYDDPSDCGAQSRTMNQSPTKGNVTTITTLYKEKQAGAADPAVNMSYDPVFGNLVCTQDAKGNVSRMQYDIGTRTYVTKTISPLVQSNQVQQTSTIQYYGVDSVPLTGGLYGQVYSVIDPNGVTGTMTYDALGRRTLSTDPYGAATAYSYPEAGSFGNVGQQHVTTTASVDYSGSVTWNEIYFDGFGRTIKTKALGPDNRVVAANTTYDARGAVSRSSLPYFENTSDTARWQTFKYDPMGRVTQVINSDGTTGQTCYKNGVTAGIDPDGHKKRQTTDIFGRLVQVDEYDASFSQCSTDLGANNLTTTYQYDTLGNLILVTDAENNPTTMNYDSLGRKTSMTDPDMGIWSYKYDYNGNLLKQTDAKNQAINFAYDELGRIATKTYPDGAQVTYTYDVAPDGTAQTYAVGRLSKIGDSTGSASFYYDKLGRSTKTSKVVDTTRYDFLTSYDALGRVASLTYPDLETVSYSYNTGGLLSSITGAGVNYATYVGYNALGQPGTITYGNGIATTYQYYTTNNRLQSIVTGNANQQLINLAYDYYPGGNLKYTTDSVNYIRSQSFLYDGLDRIQQAQSSGYPVNNGVLWYGYSPTGNITMKEGNTYTYNGGHAVRSTSPDNRTFFYDQNGNMTQEMLGSNVYRTITYNYDNMPQSVTVNNTTTSFVYDGTGARVKKSGPFGENVYLGKLYECKEGVCTKYIFGGDTRIAMKTGNDVLYYHGDHLGSTQAVTQTGAIQDNLCSTQPVRIAGTTPRYFPTIQDAYNAASNGDVIQARAVNFGSVDFPVILNLSSGVTVTINGGYDCGYTSQVENSELVGMINDNTGAVTLGNFEIVIAGYPKQRVDLVRYRPFGETIDEVGILSVTHKYTAQEFDAETGLYNYNARLYNPALGRFISADTMVSDPAGPQALNRSSYVLNNPLRYIDPTGHDEDGSWWSDWWNSWSWSGNDYSGGSSGSTDLSFYIQPDSSSYGSGYGLGFGAGNGYGYAPDTRDPMPTGGGYGSSTYNTSASVSQGDNSTGGNISQGPTIVTANVGPLYNNVVQPAVSYLTNPANGWTSGQPQGWCARAIRQALNAGGIATPYNSRPRSAAGYQTYLPTLGFQAVSLNGYQPQAGDIAVFPAITRNPYGHIEMYTGNSWQSDYHQQARQRDGSYGGGFFANDRWVSYPFTIFRYGGF